MTSISFGIRRQWCMARCARRCSTWPTAIWWRTICLAIWLAETGVKLAPSIAEILAELENLAGRSARR